MKKLIIPIIALLVLVLIFLAVAYKPAVHKTEHVTVLLGGQEITAEVVRTPEGRAQGLSGREALEEGTGMLFVFDTPDVYSFWMYDMRFPIDIMWIESGEVVDLWRDAQPPVEGEDIPRYVPGAAAQYVLEVPAGFTKEYNVRIGSEIVIE